ncbi:sodium/glutamate symporter [Phenylobacterium sp.]|uniref:sodium/glutamate symporter n=1 Tax=Phenylobacterium sp. TaxID=1871053 RepID=UPI002B6F337D|nr:sodium/glutamate symporter [Phenylobacterium sp.]HVI33719.1 sodium/glutamate symporter [Phenylobacterium sp.]
MTLNALETTALGCVLLLVGYGLRDRVRLLDQLNLPAPVIGGMLAALVALAARLSGLPPVKFDAALQSPMMIAFFTTLGFAASYRLLMRGGPQVVLLLGLAAAVAVLQALLGAGISAAFGLNPLLGVLTGTATLSGGPATGLAFAPQFEAAGVPGAAAVATANAMAGIVLASVFGAPLATWVIVRRRLDPRLQPPLETVVTVTAEAGPPHGHAALTFMVLKTAALIAVSMWLGGLVSASIKSAGVVLPPYIGAMLVAGALRNLDDATGLVKLPIAAIEVAGAIALSLFLVLAIMTLDLTQLAGLALPLMVILAAQLALVSLLVVGPVWWLMGRTYDAAVAAGGFAGFMLGTTANAMAIMRALVEKYADAPRAFLTVPLVGAFFIDFVNALIITGFLNLWG